MLECELRAIDRWDTDYWRKRRRENYEKAAYLSRQARRGEILRLLKQFSPVSHCRPGKGYIPGSLSALLDPKTIRSSLMGVVIDFDAKNNILRVTVEGRLTDAILKHTYETAINSPALPEQCRCLIDVSKVEEMEVSSDTIKQVARLPTSVVKSMGIVVAPREYFYAMWRMFQIHSERTRPNFHVVHTMDEAYHLLGVQFADFAPLSWVKAG
jgi:hypothetical protein